MTIALDMLGYIVRKQPTWLHRVAQHQLIKDLLRLLKTETDVVVLVPSLLVLVSLLPAVSAKLSNYMSELFEVFSRLCLYKWKDGSTIVGLILHPPHGGHLRLLLEAVRHVPLQLPLFTL